MSPAKTEALQKRPFRILFVDDDFRTISDGVPVVEGELEKLLGRSVTHEVAQSSREAEALLLASRDAPPDVVVLDVMLPEETGGKVQMTEGILLLARIRQALGEPWADTPVLVLTARNVPQLRSLIESGKALAWKGKPAHPRKLAQAIAEVAARREAQK